MSEMTPEQYRLLADAFENDREDRQEVLAALRAAADQLEAGSFDAGYRNGYKVGYMHASGKADAL